MVGAQAAGEAVVSWMASRLGSVTAARIGSFAGRGRWERRRTWGRRRAGCGLTAEGHVVGAGRRQRPLLAAGHRGPGRPRRPPPAAHQSPTPREARIIKHKKNKCAWDEQTNSWKWTYGYDCVNDDRDVPIIEAKLTDAEQLVFSIYGW